MSRRSNAESVFEGSTKPRATAAGISASGPSEQIASSAVPFFTMQACIHRCTRSKPGSVAIRDNLALFRCTGVFLLPELARLQRLAMDHIEIWNVGVPFQQSRD